MFKKYKSIFLILPLFLLVKGSVTDLHVRFLSQSVKYWTDKHEDSPTVFKGDIFKICKSICKLDYLLFAIQ